MDGYVTLTLTLSLGTQSISLTRYEDPHLSQITQGLCVPTIDAAPPYPYYSPIAIGRSITITITSLPSDISDIPSPVKILPTPYYRSLP
jgi:hypothetical protein